MCVYIYVVVCMRGLSDSVGTLLKITYSSLCKFELVFDIYVVTLLQVAGHLGSVYSYVGLFNQNGFFKLYHSS